MVRPSTGAWQTRSGQLASEGLRQALVEGTQYMWNRKLLSQNVSILWRTAYEGDPLDGFSGTALCLGKPNDQTCRVICFQNFQVPLFDAILQKYNFEPKPGEKKHSTRPFVIESLRRVICWPLALDYYANSFIRSCCLTTG
jgi:hypothetical protein